MSVMVRVRVDIISSSQGGHLCIGPYVRRCANGSVGASSSTPTSIHPYCGGQGTSPPHTVPHPPSQTADTIARATATTTTTSLATVFQSLLHRYSTVAGCNMGCI